MNSEGKIPQWWYSRGNGTTDNSDVEKPPSPPSPPSPSPTASSETFNETLPHWWIARKPRPNCLEN